MTRIAAAVAALTAAVTAFAATGCGRDTPVSPVSGRTGPPVAPADPSGAGTGAPAGTASPAAPGTVSASPDAGARENAGPPAFSAKVERVTRSDVRYSWRSGCPVELSGLRLIKMTYWGFDGKAHVGELVVNAKATGDMTKAFKRLYDKRYPIRRMERVDVYKGSDFDSIEADNTSAFNCRSATGSSSWSQHAYGLAVDINPCENPYVSSGGDVAHKDCVKYKNRSRRDPGVIHKNDLVVRAFAKVGWSWGGLWAGTKDYQHFSSNGG